MDLVRAIQINTCRHNVITAFPNTFQHFKSKSHTTDVLHMTDSILYFQSPTSVWV